MGRLYYFPLISEVSSIRVLDCTNNLNHSESSLVSGAYLSNVLIPTEGDLTVCLRFKFTKLTPVSVLVDSAISGRRPSLHFREYLKEKKLQCLSNQQILSLHDLIFSFLETFVDRLRYAIAEEYRFVLLDDWLLPLIWYHVCIVKQRNRISVFLDGRNIQNDTLHINAVPKYTNVTVGYLDPFLYPDLFYIGYVSQFNVWDKLLNDRDIKEMSSCFKDMNGNVVSWNDQWQNSNSLSYDQPLQMFCVQEIVTNLQILPLLKFIEAMYVCEALGGTPQIPELHNETEEMFNFGLQQSSCSVFWVGIWDNLEEGNWVIYNQQKNPSRIPWAPDEPNGIQFENCGGLDREGIVDDGCDNLR